MTIEIVLFGACMGVYFVAMVLFVLFGQVSVRKLRKNTETRDALGMEFASGWDILNVAGALAMPRWLNRKLRSTPLSFLYANADILDKHTNTFDRIVAVLLYWMFLSATVVVMVLAILDGFDVFD